MQWKERYIVVRVVWVAQDFTPLRSQIAQASPKSASILLRAFFDSVKISTRVGQVLQAEDG